MLPSWLKSLQRYRWQSWVTVDRPGGEGWQNLRLKSEISCAIAQENLAGAERDVLLSIVVEVGGDRREGFQILDAGNEWRSKVPLPLPGSTSSPGPPLNRV